MTWSLQLEHGDLSFSGNSLRTVTGAAKLVQDLRCVILEPIGTDDAHPDYGSTLDGGINPDGTLATGVIGAQNDSLAAAFANAEINRLAQWYQTQQASRNAADVATYGKSTLTADEALLAVEQVDIQQVETSMLISVTLQTGAGTQSVSVPIST